MMTFYACSCGVEHDVDPHVADIIDELGELIVIQTPAGRWNVPRVYIVHHGIKANEIPALATKYGWTSPSD